MNGALTLPGRLELTALGTSALLLVADPGRLDRAAVVLRAELAEIDRACSRFRSDSEITKLHRSAGRPVTVSPLLAEALDAALRAAELTGGLVDPTVGAAVRALGYDRDFAQVHAMEARRGTGRAGPPAEPARPAPGWWRLHWDRASREVLLPRGVTLDLGATAKALAADRAAHRAAEAAGCGVLVGLGGDLGIAGTPPEGGWRVAVADDHRDALDTPAQIISVASGGLATSSTVARAWRHGGRRRHHIVDPRTGENPVPLWRTVSVAAGSCVDANTASTAAIVLGRAATDWLVRRGMPARLVTEDGQVVHTAGWPLTEEGG
ncbi:MAG TPA: FAD:protein FMN transferase [Pseudonocardia sp.]|nr:FAD:protein FMN transferase [Pseudonocardia sp.]